jgi:aminoglycoside phosphotransferase (APT) family kinase protein
MGVIATFLSELHAVEPIHTSIHELPPEPSEALPFRQRCSWARSALTRLREEELLESDLASSLERVLDNAKERQGTECIIHGDLYAAHILLSEHLLPSGVVDWGGICLDDPARDLSVVYAYFPPGLRERFREAYQGAVDEETWQLARVLALCQMTVLARYAKSVGDSGILREALLALRWIAVT